MYEWVHRSSRGATATRQTSWRSCSSRWPRGAALPCQPRQRPTDPRSPWALRAGCARLRARARVLSCEVLRQMPSQHKLVATTTWLLVAALALAATASASRDEGPSADDTFDLVEPLQFAKL